MFFFPNSKTYSGYDKNQNDKKVKAGIARKMTNNCKTKTHRQNFSAAFFQLCFGKKALSYEKGARKMLMKLPPGKLNCKNEDE